MIDELPALAKPAQRDDIPASEDLLSAAGVARLLRERGEGPLSIIVAGDTMLGGRSRRFIAANGADYPFAAVKPLLDHAHHVLVNLEGPFARLAKKQDRNYSYRVDPRLAAALRRAGVTTVTLANNHLLDCGRDGVSETLAAAAAEDIAVIGAGANRSAAHAPSIVEARGRRIGLLGYYWNTRTAASTDLPGSAMDPPHLLEADIRELRSRVDRVVVTFHWGVPYNRQPSQEDRAKARMAVEFGADAVVGHHPHVLQPFEIYRDRPIFYSVGNFAFGSGNSRAEGILVGLRFDAHDTVVQVYPLYVKNRDKRVAYQPKILTGAAAVRALEQLAAMSGSDGHRLTTGRGVGEIVLPYDGARVSLPRTAGA